MACLGYACHHSDKRQGHQGIVGYLSPPTYRQPAILDRWESGFVCSLSLSLCLTLSDRLAVFLSVTGLILIYLISGWHINLLIFY